VNGVAEHWCPSADGRNPQVSPRWPGQRLDTWQGQPWVVKSFSYRPLYFVWMVAITMNEFLRHDSFIHG
jgi:hypothetical protein